MYLKKTHLVQLLIIMLLFGLVFLNAKSYVLWGQVESLWASRVNPFKADSISDLGAHGLRYALVYPLFILSDAINVHYNTLFEMTVPLLAYAVLRNTWSVLINLSNERRESYIASLFISFLFLFLFLSMNGRIALAFFGYSLIFRTLTNFHYCKSKLTFFQVILISIGVLFCSVSSGTLISGFILILVSLGALSLRIYSDLKFRWYELYLFLGLVLCLQLFGAFILIGVIKNVTFFGGGFGGFIEMLNHGAGKFILPLLDIFPAPILIIFSSLFLSSCVYIISVVRYSYLLTQMIGATSIGVFGYSTLSLVSIPVAVIAGLFILNELKFGVKIHSV